MLVVGNERYILKVYKRVPNSPYEWEPTPSIVFKGRPASQVEKKLYRIQQGAHSGSDSTYVVTSNLRLDIQVEDKIEFLGKEWIVESTGYYFDESRVVNPGVMNEKYIAKRCPKGLTLQ